MHLSNESVQRHENKTERGTEIFSEADGVTHLASIKTAHGVFRSPAVKLAPVFNDGDVGTRELGIE